MAMLVLCSSSHGQGNETTAALYWLIFDGTALHVTYISGSSGQMTDNPELWTFTLDAQNIIVVCAQSSPCRFAFITNMELTKTTKTNESNKV